MVPDLVPECQFGPTVAGKGKARKGDWNLVSRHGDAVLLALNDV